MKVHDVAWNPFVDDDFLVCDKIIDEDFDSNKPKLPEQASIRIFLKPSFKTFFSLNMANSVVFVHTARDLEQEARRVFEICHNCRMCVNYCGSFPDLFARVDRDIEKQGAQGAELLDIHDFESVTNLCWQCKLCYIKCPYTQDEGHEWL
ncbi:MAG TPA: 4Fe-4S dicluster domain-containing protein, partial [Pseudobdellovibrionaceae bacterium]|nr:4Fe-4S dicluster domain-containing protein [Pseudobdellovibrionaceae bacterium]